MIARFIDEHKQEFGVESICATLSLHGCQIAPSTYYAHRARQPSARVLQEALVTNTIRNLRLDPAGRATPESLYGVRKTWRALLQGPGALQVARCTVERVMRANDWQGVRRGRGVRTTIAAGDGVRADDLLGRDFTAPHPDHTWVADFTYVRTWVGFVYVAFVLDVYSQKIVGWHAATTKHQDLVLAAVRMATWSRAHAGHPITPGLIHHSDAGSQYTALKFTERLELEGLVPSIGTVGDAYDNALMESTIGLYKNECIRTTIFHNGPYKNINDVEYATLAYIDWFNNRRLHSSIDYASPATYEASYYATNPAPHAPAPANH